MLDAEFWIKLMKENLNNWEVVTRDKHVINIEENVDECAIVVVDEEGGINFVEKKLNVNNHHLVACLKP